MDGVEQTQGNLQLTKVYYNPSVIGVDRAHYFGDFSINILKVCHDFDDVYMICIMPSQ